MIQNNLNISKNFIISIIILSLVLFAFSSNIGGVNAADLNESSDNYGISAIDEDKLENSQDGEILQASRTLTSGTFADIQSAIDLSSAGDTIYLNGEFKTDRAESHIYLNKKLTITSSSTATINAQNLSSIFIVEPTSSGSSFSNIKFINGNGYQGGACLIHAKDITFTNCEFTRNYAQSGGGAIYTTYDVVTNPDHGKNLLISNCKFTGNFAVTAAGAIGAYADNVRILNSYFDSNSVYDSSGKRVYGGAIQIGRDGIASTALVSGCTFINNKATSTSGAPSSHGGAGCVRDGITYENCIFEKNSADQGGALTYHASGTIRNCTFIDNSAKEFGGALSTGWVDLTMNLKIVDSTFTNNKAPYGGAAQLNGMNVEISNGVFKNNFASTDGGAIYINATTVNIYESEFSANSANNNGGAVYINGKSTTIQQSTFKTNEAIASTNSGSDGLGGAIYIKGSSASIRNNNFELNVARNGSALYYDKTGQDLTLTNNVMYRNQAWVYALPLSVTNIYYGDSEKITATIYGGNNIADYDNLAVSNAIYNAASNRYIKVNGETPVSGATSSGELYQDSREYNIDILLTVKHEDGSVVYSKTLKSSYLGQVSDTLTNLKPGKYTVTAIHYEDTYYKAITNTATFTVTSKVDVSVTKQSDYNEYNYRQNAVWTLTVANNGPNDATGVKVTDSLPEGLVYVSDNSGGKYNKNTGVWTIGNLASGKSSTIQITTLVNKTGDITNKAAVTANEYDSNSANNNAEKKITVKSASDLSVTKTSNVSTPNYGNLVKWTITVKNNGPDTAHSVIVSDAIPSGLTFKSSNGNYNSGKWTIGTLNAGQSAALEIITQVAKTGSIKNTASVTCSEYDYNSANNEASATITVPKAIDLVVSKSVNNTAPKYGESVKWTLTVKNNGVDDATGVKLTDAIPAGLTYVSSSGNYQNGVWTIGNLAKGSGITLDLVTKVSKTGDIKNTATVSGNEYDVDSSNNKAESTISVGTSADLQVTKNVNNTQPNLGDLIKWTVTVKNNGPDIAHDISVIEALPSTLIFKSATGSYNYGRWTIASLASGASQNLEIITQVNNTGSITNKVSVTGREYDYNYANNNAEKTVNVPKASDLMITKTNNNTSPNYGEFVKWTITVKNNGIDAASGVKVSDVLPAGLIYQSSTANYANGEWIIGNLAVGESAVMNMVTKVSKTGSIQNTATVRGNEYDINSENNRATSQITVKPASDIEITKNVNTTSPNYKNSVKWTITVKNNGPDVAHNVVVSDNMDSGLGFVSATGNYNSGKWTISVLGVGESQTLELITTTEKTSHITNKVSAVCDEYDYNLANNNAEKTVTVPPSADLEIIKMVNTTSPSYKNLVKWTLTVRNNGPDDATGVRVTDVLPEGLIYVSSTGNYANGIWSIGSLKRGQVLNIDIISQVNKTGFIINSAQITGNEYDSNKNNNINNESIYVAPAGDLEILKTVNTTQPNYRDNVKWTVTVKNNGLDTVHNVVVSDDLDSELVFVSATGNYNSGKWVINSLGTGSSITLELITLVNKTGSITNNVSVKGLEYDFNLANNNADKTVIVPKASDLTITKDVNESMPNYTKLVKWTVTVTNNGPDNATGVKVTDVLPEGLIYISSNSSYVDGEWIIGNLESGESISMEIISKINKTGLIENTADVIGNEYDVDKSNNVASESIIVPSASDLEVIKNVNNTNPNYGDEIEWTVTVKNNGPDTAHNIIVSDDLAEGLIFKNADGNYNSGKWIIDNLGVGETTILKIVSKVNKTGSITNNVSLIGQEFDFNLANNNADKTIIVPPASDLIITKDVNETAPDYTKLVKWTVTVKNNGPDNATGVKVSDILPAALVFISSNGNYTNGVWTVGNLMNGEEKTLEIISKVSATGAILNTANVTGNEYDINKTNNIASESIIVPPASDLIITKTVNDSAPNYRELVKWTIDVYNDGPDTAHNISIEEMLPQGLIIEEMSKELYIESLNAGELVTIEIITYINKTGIMMNNASVSGDEFDYNMENNIHGSPISVPNAGDLEIIKSVNNSNPNYKDLIKWTVTVKNNGPDVATGVCVDEELPEGFIIAGLSESKGQYVNGVWTVGNLNVGEMAVLEIHTLVNNTGNFTNTVNVYGNEYDWDMSNNHASIDVSVLPAADLEITKTVNNTSPNYKDMVEWTVTVKNNGPDTATNIRVTEEVIGIVNYKVTEGSYENGIWSVASLNAGETATLTVTTKADTIGVTKNTVNVRGDEYDYNMENNDGEASINVSPASDLEITKTANQTTFNYTDLIKWIITVKNNGPSPADGVVVLDTLPDGLTFISSNGNYTQNQWTVGNLAVGEVKEIEIITRADKTGEFINIATVSGNQYDWDLTNNNKDASINVNPAADLAIIKTSESTVYETGDLITYTIEVTNNGPDTAFNIKVNEVMDESLVFDSYSSTSGVYDALGHIWTIESLANGEKAILTINAIAVREGLFNNSVSVSSDTFDLNLDNNYAEAIVTVVEKTVLSNDTGKNLLSEHGIDGKVVSKNLKSIVKSNLGEKETGLPLGLLILVSLISLIFCNSNKSKKR